MRRVFVSLLLAVVCFNPGVVAAATISAEGGSVFVDLGKGFVPVAGSANVAAGSKILVRGGGSAIISYSSTCSVRVGGSRVWHVAPKAPCAPGNSFIDLASVTGYVGGDGQGANGGGSSAGGGWEATTTEACCEPVSSAAAGGGFSPTMVVVGGLVVAGGVGLAVAASSSSSDDDDTRPASP